MTDFRSPEKKGGSTKDSHGGNTEEYWTGNNQNLPHQVICTKDSSEIHQEIQADPPVRCMRSGYRAVDSCGAGIWPPLHGALESENKWYLLLPKNHETVSTWKHYCRPTVGRQYSRKVFCSVLFCSRSDPRTIFPR